MARASSDSRSLRINTTFVDTSTDAKLPASAAYAYSAGGRLLAFADVDPKSGHATLQLPTSSEPTGVRVLVGPALPRGEEPDLEELLRRGAVERHLRVEPKLELPALEFEIFPDVWHCWLAGLCVVKGTVLKRIVRDGLPVDFPVCHATVEIYEVDPFYLIVPKLPPLVIDRLREVITGRIPPIPEPLPDPFPEEPLPPIPEPDPPPFRTFAAKTAAQRSASTHRVDAEAIEALHAASGTGALRFAAISGSDLAFRQALIEHAVLIRPILCWLFPRFVTMQLIRTVTTDDCGHFRTRIFKGCHNHDQPDLYFKVRQRIFGFFDVVIHAPTPIACHTWWNYTCGSEVTLHVTHPLAITCRPCPPIIAGDNWVLFMAIGNHPLSLIHGTGQSLIPATTSTNRGLTSGLAPWGGTLRPRLEFDNALRESLGVKYYRLSWKRNAEADSDYKPLIGDIARHYAHMVGTDLVLDAYPLGPNTVGGNGGLFEIPPAVPPLGQWSLPNVVADTSSGVFNSAAGDGTPLLDGKIQIRVELFDNAGAAVNIAAKGIRYFVPTSTDLSGTVHTVDASTPGLNLVAGNTMVITLHVNNEACGAGIAAPSIGGATADPCCGVLEYGAGDTVTMPWTASHPHGYATYGFGVVRGIQGVFSSSGAVAGGSFSATRTVYQLMNDNLPPGCAEGGCTVAGFSENLHVYAMATDGWSRQSQYDDGDVRAFVLAPTA
jgi:hypothetical protein